MARNENKYVSLRLTWDKFIDKLSGSSLSTKMIGSGWTEKQLETEVYSFLTDNDFDGKGFDFVYESIKIDNPSLTKEQFFKKYIHQKIDGKKINILDNIDNKATAKRITKRLSGELSVLEGRISRLKTYGTNVTRDSVERSINDVKRIVETTKTSEKHIRDNINERERVLRRKDITPAERKALKTDINDFKKQLKVTQKSNKVLSKEYNKFAKTYTDMDDYRLSKSYNKLLGVIDTDIVRNQQKVVFAQTMKSSASHQMKTVAQTEYVKTVTNNDLAELKSLQTKDNILLVKYTLSASHRIYDICDVHANKDNGYGKGIYELDKAPIPVVDTHPNCRCSLVSHSFKE